MPSSVKRKKTLLISKQYNALKLLCAKGTSRPLYKAILKESNAPLITALAQCAKNLLYNKSVLLDRKIILKINKNRSFFDFLSAPNNSVTSKRKKLVVNQKLIKIALPAVLDYYTNIVRAQNGPTNTVEKSGN